MNGSVRIPEWAARIALRALEAQRGFVSTGAVDALRRALEPKPARVARDKVKAKKKRAKSKDTKSIRAAVMERANGKCELCGIEYHSLELHHVLGRVRAKQDISNCLACCRFCHVGLTRNDPSAAFWLNKQAVKLDSLGHHATAVRLWGRKDAIELSRGNGAA